jgi:four helix bundle protein
MNRYGDSASPFGFEDLDVYREACSLRQMVYGLAKSLPEQERHALSQQMRRAAVSVASNIAEGYGRFHAQENTQFCRHARGSLMELTDQVTACHEQGYCGPDLQQALREKILAVLRLLNGYISYLQRRKEKRQS